MGPGPTVVGATVVQSVGQRLFAPSESAGRVVRRIALTPELACGNWRTSQDPERVQAYPAEVTLSLPLGDIEDGGGTDAVSGYLCDVDEPRTC